MADENSADEPETCSLCAETGPPKAPPVPDSSAVEGGATAEDSDASALQWIACTKCGTWLHSVCVVSSPAFHDASVPPSLREEIIASGRGVWYDWAARVDKW